MSQVACDHGTEALDLDRVSVVLGRVQVLSNVTCTLEPGRLNAIIGPNGAGKTTLLRAILGLVPYSGSIRVGQRCDGKPMRLAYVPQRLDFDRGMPVSVRDFLCAGLQKRPLWMGWKREAQDVGMTQLARVGGGDWGRRLLGQLSGGELQRVLLAMALTSEPDILLLDEPVAGVDVAGEELFCDLLGALQAEGHYTMLLVSHDLSLVTEHARYVICLNQTVQCAGPTIETLTAENLKSTYGHDVGLYSHGGSHEGHSHHHDEGCEH